jgi:protein TonB
MHASSMDPGTPRRLLVAVVGSFLIHAALLYTVRVVHMPSTPGGVILQARLAAVPREPPQPKVSLARLHEARPDRPSPAPRRRLPAHAAVDAAAGAPPGASAAQRHSALSPATALQPAAYTPPPSAAVPFVRDTTWYPARQLDVFPRALATPRPVYPAEAGAAEGEVTLLVMVDDVGGVHEVSVVEATPPGVFDRAAMQAFETLRFEPAMKDGRAVRSRILVRVSFGAAPQE